MNIAAMLELKGWLEAGAPHVRFDIDMGYVTESCGTAVCIAGSCIVLSGQAAKFDGSGGGADWFKVAAAALEWLDLPDNGTLYGHRLFAADLAPANCTPAQAALAVQNVIDGKQPWEGVE